MSGLKGELCELISVKGHVFGVDDTLVGRRVRLSIVLFQVLLALGNLYQNVKQLLIELAFTQINNESQHHQIAGDQLLLTPDKRCDIE